MTKAKIFWFTGLSGAGKSTVADLVKHKIEKNGQEILVIDGDEVRKKYTNHLGFTADDITKNNEIVATLCKENAIKYQYILVPIISPLRDVRESVYEQLRREGLECFEIYFAANLETTIDRDVKGLYQKAMRGEIKNMIGFSPEAPYEAPLSPDLVIDSSNNKELPESSALKLFHFLIEGCFHAKKTRP
jgi:adenylyl-sulfate kinase